MGASPAAARAFSDSERRLLDWLNGLSRTEFVEWYRGDFEPSLHPVGVVTASRHILGGRLDPSSVREPARTVDTSDDSQSIFDRVLATLGLTARWS